MFKFIFWICFGLILYVYFGYLLTVLILAKFSKKAPVNKKDFNLFISLIIPAYNEAKVIKKKLENSFSLDYPKDKIEIIVISDCSTDNTNGIVKEFIPQGVKLIAQEKRNGKISGLNKSVPQAKGEIIVFTDANSMFEKDAIKKLVRNFNDKRVGCVCGELKYTIQEAKTSLAELGESMYWKYERFLKIQESRLHSLLIANGSIYAIRKELYSSIDEAMADDFANPIRIAAKGWSVIYEPEAVTIEPVSCLMKEQFKQKTRIMAQGYRASFGLIKEIFSSGFLRVFEFLSHKFLRWFVPLFLIGFFISSIFLMNERFYGIVFILQCFFYLSALVGYILQRLNKLTKIFYIPAYFCMVNLASLVGFFYFLTNRQKRIWEKAESTR